MTLSQGGDPDPLLDQEDATTIYCTPATQPETIAAHPPNKPDAEQPSTSFVPWPGSTFIIRSLSSGHVIALLEGEVVLSQPGGPGSIHWACVETKGWLGFRNPVSGMFLGHDGDGILRCSAKQHQETGNFCVRMRPEGGCVLLMVHSGSLWHVGVKEEEEGVEVLAKLGEGGSGGMVWEFAKVSSSQSFSRSPELLNDDAGQNRQKNS